MFEHQLIEDGIILVKYWFSVSDEEQERRFQVRVDDPLRRWKLSAIDLEARQRWSDYSRAKDAMFLHTDTPESPWYVVDAEDKRRARLNCIAHLLVLRALPAGRRGPPQAAEAGEGRRLPPTARDLYTYVPDYRLDADRLGPDRRAQPGMRRQTARGSWRITANTQRSTGGA